MPTKRERQKETRERSLLEAAEQLFVDRGYAETSIGDVADRAGLAVGTFYNYFTSKGEVLAAILRQGTDDVLSAVEAVALERPADPSRAISSVLDIVIDLVTRHKRALWREVLPTALAHPDTVGPRLFEADLRIMSLLTNLIRELQRQGRLAREVDPGRSAIVLYAGCLAWIVAYVSSEDLTIEALHAEVHRGVEIVVRGLTNDRHGGAA